jgi:hypothetical protein
MDPFAKQRRIRLFINELYLQPGHNTPVHQMFVNDFINIITIKVRVPDLIRVNDNDGAKFAAIQTSRCIYADLAWPSQAQPFDSLLGIIANGCCVTLLATLLALFPLVGTEKYVIFVIRHLALL